MSDLHLGERLAAVRAIVDEWVADLGTDNPMVASVEHDTVDGTTFGEPLWLIRLVGESVDVVTVWIRLGQRTLRYETYLLPVPPERMALVAEYLIQQNHSIIGAHFSIGPDHGVYLRGDLPDRGLTVDELDRIVGTLYDGVERRIGNLVELAYGKSPAGSSPASDEPGSAAHRPR